MGFHTAICKNEVERFNLVKENYNGNLPEIIRGVFISIESYSGEFDYKRLDWGSEGVSLSKEELISALNYTLDKEYLLPWQLENCVELIQFVTNHEDEDFMLVRYEI